MITAKQLKDDYEKKLKELQQSCKHENVSDWLEHSFAPAHYSGFQVKQCNDCWKFLQYKFRCIACEKEIITDKQRNVYQSDCLCNDCSKKGKYYCFTHKKFHDNPQGCSKCMKFLDEVEKIEMEEAGELL